MYEEYSEDLENPKKAKLYDVGDKHSKHSLKNWKSIDRNLDYDPRKLPRNLKSSQIYKNGRNRKVQDDGLHFIQYVSEDEYVSKIVTQRVQCLFVLYRVLIGTYVKTL